MQTPPALLHHIAELTCQQAAVSQLQDVAPPCNALIGKGEKSSKTGQGFEHLVSIEAVSDLFGGSGRLTNGIYSVEAYFPTDLGGDHCMSTLDFEAPAAEIDMSAG